jgi:hypothetical protein
MLIISVKYTLDETKLEQLYTACKLHCAKFEVLTALMVNLEFIHLIR